MFQNFENRSEGAASADRIRALRDRLEAKGLTGFLIPRSDAHQGEVVAPSDARLAWLTGFTGSAGIAVILADRAAIFVDGRYTLQAADQCDTDLVEVVPSMETPLGDWLAEALSAGDVVGYDPWLHGRDEVDRLETALAPAEIRLVAVRENPVDAIWHERPPVPGGAVSIREEALAGEAAAAKRQRLGAELGADAAFLSLPDSLAWLLNMRGSDLEHSPVALGFGVLKSDGHVDLFMDPDKFSGAVLAHLGNEVTIHRPDTLEGYLSALGDKKIRLDRRTCPIKVADLLRDAGAEIDWGTDPCIDAKAVKNAAELEGMRRAHQADGRAMVRFLHWLESQPADAGLTEIDLVERLEAFRSDAGILDISFDTICGAGPNGAIVHYRVNRQSNRPISAGDVILIDSGGQYESGTTDITRTVPFGQTDPVAIRPFTLVLKGMISLSRAHWPEGLAGRDIDPLARSAMWRAGMDYDHGTGHGVGAYLNVHEGPASISRRGEAPLRPGMILSNEPGYYRTGSFGIRIENLVIVTPPEVPGGGERAMLGFETLTLCPIDRRLIDTALLDDAEIAWLDRYHRRVAETLTPDLPEDAADWLARATRPLGDAP